MSKSSNMKKHHPVIASLEKKFDRLNDSIEARKSRLYWNSLGIFPHIEAFVDAVDDDDGKGDGVLERDLTTDLPGGSKVSARDYALKWKNCLKSDSPSSTHEICCRGEFVYVSGYSTNMIARIYKKDPTKQVLFEFPAFDGKEADPHTLRFAPNSKNTILFVGLENQGRIVTIDIDQLVENYNVKNEDLGDPIELTEDDFIDKFDVRLSGGDSVPTPINTRPHGFCFDAKCENIWFTGKLTNTVGRVNLKTSELEHFELPTLGAVPIYLALGPDDNIWGTCLANNTIFRVTTGKHPVVHELSISTKAAHERPIAIKPDPNRNYMWFTTEAGHNVCRVDIDEFNREFPATSTGKGKKAKKGSQCVCSIGCEKLFRGSKFTKKIITEFSVPKVNRNMKVGGLAISPDGSIWVQSYMDPAENEIENFPDYIVKIGFGVQNPIGKYNRKVNTTGVPIEFYQLPTKDTVLHRITLDEEGTPWFTEQYADRVGVLRFTDSGETTKKRGRNAPAQRQSKRRRTRT